MPLKGAAAGISLRRAAAVSTLVFGIITVGAAAGLVSLTDQLHERTMAIVRDARSLSIADQIELRLEMHGRQGSLLAATGDPYFAAQRRETERHIDAHLRASERLIADEREREALEEARAEMHAALLERRELEAQGLTLDQVLRRTGDQYRRAHDAMSRLRAVNERQVDSALRQVTELDALATWTSASATTLIILGLLALAVGFSRLVLAPLRELTTAVATRRDRHLDVEVRGALEIRQITRAINEMTAALAREREDRLAFVAGVAHDLRSPLSAIKIAVGHAKQRPEDASRVLDIAERQVQTLSRMVGDLLDAARDEAGELRLWLERVNLHTVAAEVVERHRASAEKHTLHLEAPDAPVEVRADAVRMEQVIENLVSNAIKYSPAGGPVTVRLGTTPGGVCIEVQDSGIGIASGDIPQVFVAFRRRPAGEAVAPGTGIGLSVVQRIVRAHGGTISVESEVGVGTKFRVELPRAD